MASGSSTPCSLGYLLHDTLETLRQNGNGSPSDHLTSLQAAVEEFSSCMQSLAEGAPAAASIKSKTYFDELPERALDSIIRHFSERPKSLRWEKYISSADAQSLYCGEGELAKFFRARFPAVEISWNNYPPKPSPKAPQFFSKPFAMSLSCRGWISGAAEVLKAANSSIMTLRFRGDGDRDSPPHVVNWIDMFRKHCTSVRHLDIACTSVPHFKMILRPRSGLLESLSLDSFCCSIAHFSVVEKCCNGLRSLKLCLQESTPRSLWTAIGATLEELNLSVTMYSPYDDPDEPPSPHIQRSLTCIQHSCRVLRRIAILSRCDNRYINSNVTTLLRSYGDQLEYAAADFSAMAPIHRRNIAASCPNAIFEIPYLRQVSVLQDLGFRVHRLEKSERFALTPHTTEVIGANCHELQELSLKYLGWEAPITIAGLLHQPKPNLTDLKLDLLNENIHQVLYELALYTSTLRRVRISAKEVGSDGFREFFRVNPLLQKIALITSGIVSAESMTAASEIVEFCSNLDSLRELVITDPAVKNTSCLSFRVSGATRIANACVRLRARQTHVHIFGVDYL